MRADWQPVLERWVDVQLIDISTAERIRQYESQNAKPGGLRWPVLLALAFGGLMLGAGVVLFVAAHWETLSPAGRFSLVLAMVALFHVAGALVTERFAILATVLHGVGTAALGGGIFLAGQIFNLQEHWPGGIMLWAIGAWIAWALRRDWVQAAFAAVLTPWWLVGEWFVATEHCAGNERIPAVGLLALAITYLGARWGSTRSHVRRMLAWTGGIALIPCAAFAIEAAKIGTYSWSNQRPIPAALLISGWALALVLPLLLAYLLRGRSAWANAAASAWAVLLVFSHLKNADLPSELLPYAWDQLSVYVLCAIGSIGLALWGLKEARPERVNLGVVGFAATILFFYFSEVMDKLGRSASLMGFGVLFLVLGWSMERARRKLLARVAGGAR